MNVFTIAPGVPFLDALAAWWLAARPDPVDCAEGLFLLPTRRAARELGAAFLREAGGRALLLPRIAALGAADEAPLTLAGALSVPPALPEAERLAGLARLVLALAGRHGAPQTADRAWPLAAELGRLMDEAQREGVDLAAVLPGLVGDDFARHWAETLQFLQIVTQHWPAWLAERGTIEAAARGVRLIAAQAEAWRMTPPDMPVVVAGTAGGHSAVAALMRVVAGLPAGRVVLPGLDLDLPDAAWAALPDGHPQAGLAALLNRMGLVRGDVRAWDGPVARRVAGAAQLGRAGLVGRALLPAAALDGWRVPFQPELSGLLRLEAADEQAEAVAVALTLREALEVPGAQAALVTPDRALAGRVAAELSRFGVVVDDSAGEPLAETPPGAFLRLLARAAADGLPPVALLSVLKHPLAALGLDPAECRRRTRWLERRVLRGPAPPPGIAGLRAALAARQGEADEAQQAAAALVDALEARLAPLLSLPSPVAPDAALRALIAAAEAVAETDEVAGPARLWAMEEGEALAGHLAALLPALALLPAQPIGTLAGLLAATMEGAAVRSRRALRGRDGFEHPRVSILGLLEARLLAFDVLVLGGLVEGVWPAATDPGPWLSRPMRRAAGLESPEAAVGQAAHDFAMLACAAPRVVLSCPRRRDGAPAVPARWLVRMEAFLAGHGAALPRSPAARWAAGLDLPAGGPSPVAPPRPCPPVSARPRRLPVTAVETWLRDPYGLYAQHVLGLKVLDPLEQALDRADFGSIVHEAIAAWVGGFGATWAADAEARLALEMERALQARPLRAAQVAWWRPRLRRIAAWLAALEGERRQVARSVVGVEASGEWVLDDVNFRLTGRADRIERLAAGGLCLLDYKTGVVPSHPTVMAGYAPQLPLEAAMAAAGAFGPVAQGTVVEAAYWKLTGGPTPGEVTELKDVAGLTADAAARLRALVRMFDDPVRPYLSQPQPGAAPRFPQYAQLARVGEWSVAEEGE